MSAAQPSGKISGIKPEVYSDEEDNAVVLGSSRGIGQRKRFATLYDAVAGRCYTSEALVHTEKRRAQPNTRQSDGEPAASAPQTPRRAPPLAPDEVLFRRANAPQRFAENDIYFAHEELPDGGRGILPDSDLLKSVHSYSSRFYDALAQRRTAGSFVGRRPVDERSMDETALLATGILLEEVAREALGRRGDLVLTEGLANDRASTGRKGKRRGGGTDEEGMGQEGDTVGYRSHQDTLWKRRYQKRRRTEQSDGDDEG